MARWGLLVLLVLTLGRALLVPATPIPALQHLPQSSPQATPGLLASGSPSASSAGLSAARAPPQPGPRITLSLDVPIGLLQILLERAQARASREQASANARIMARVGRR
nr:urocortin-2 [Manis javanica]